MCRIFVLMLALILLITIPAQAAEVSAFTRLADDAQTANAMQAAHHISLVQLHYGETFSFNDAVGPRTVKAGFVPALNGRGVEVVGGGCAQAASALYLALNRLAPGTIAFDELSFYGDRYVGEYVSSGSEAVLVDHANGRDFRFTFLGDGMLAMAFTLAEGQLVCTVSVTDFAQDRAMELPALAAPSAQSSITLCCGEDPAVLNNVAVAANSVHDVCLAGGDIFSFNEIVGPRDERFGYVPAVNGRGTEVVGGGCAQVASALWLLIQDRPDFVIVEKSTYGSAYNQSYVASSADAILTDYAAGIDFAFRYTGPGAVTLYTTLEGDTLICAVG